MFCSACRRWWQSQRAQGYCKFGIGRIPQVKGRPPRHMSDTRWLDRHHRASLFNHEIIVPSSWNHDAAQFHPVCFDNQAHISRFPHLYGISHLSIHPMGTLCMSVWRRLPRPSLGHTNWPSCFQVFNVQDWWNCPLTCSELPMWARNTSLWLYRPSPRSDYLGNLTAEHRHFTHGYEL